MYSKLQYISQGTTAKEQIENIRSTLDAGCNWIQLRFKNATGKEFVKTAEQVKKICSSYNSIFIINDYVEVAKDIDADGVHLGLQDMPVSQARTILGTTKIIGGTANTFNDVIIRINDKCDYIGLGPFRHTVTKKKLSPILGIGGLDDIMKKLAKQKTKIPVYAVGGILIDDIENIINTGVYGIAVSGVITHHADKKTLLKQINNYLWTHLKLQTKNLVRDC